MLVKVYIITTLFTRLIFAIIRQCYFYPNHKVAATNISICCISGRNGKMLPSKYLPSTSAKVTRASWLFVSSCSWEAAERSTHLRVYEKNLFHVVWFGAMHACLMQVSKVWCKCQKY